MNLIRLIVLSALFIPISFPLLADDTEIKVIPLYNRSAIEIVPLIRHFLHEGDKLVGTGNQLLIRTSDKQLKEIILLVKKIDQPPHRLLITVIQGRNLSQDILSAQATLSGIITSRSQTKSQFKSGGKIRQTHSDKAANIQQSVQTLDGKQALIQFGTKQPLPEYQLHNYGNRINITSGIRYHHVTSGFYVRPKIIGNSVHLDISPWSNKLNRLNGAVIDTSRAETTLIAKMGEWIELSKQNSQSFKNSSELLSRFQSTQKQENRIFLRIEDLDNEQALPVESP